MYGFGVVLLEMLTGRRAIDKNRPAGQHYLVEWAKPLLASKRSTMNILDPKLEGQYSPSGARKTALLALQCLSMEAKQRPTMDQVVTALEQVQDAKDIGKSPKTKQKLSSQRGSTKMPQRK